MPDIDLAKSSLRELNQALHRESDGANESSWRVLNPRGSHAVVAGVDAPIDVNIMGSVGYYCAGMNKKATITVHGSAESLRT